MFSRVLPTPRARVNARSRTSRLYVLASASTVYTMITPARGLPVCLRCVISAVHAGGMLLPALLLVPLCCSAVVEAVHDLWVANGVLVNGSARTHVGNKASDLQPIIDSLGPARPLANVTALINSSQLRRLRLTGDYVADVTLHLPSMFVLALDEGTTYRGGSQTVRDPVGFSGSKCQMPVCCLPSGERVPANFTGECDCSTCDGNSMIQVTGTYFTAVLGGHFDCSALPLSYHGSAAISAAGCTAFTLSHATLSHCGVGRVWTSGNLGISKGSHGEIAHTKIYGGSRSIWTQYETNLAVHDNEFYGMWDADGHSGPHNMAWNNLFSLDSAHGITNQPAIWMEADTTQLFAWNNTIFNASIAFQGASGAGHLLIGNRILNSTSGTVLMGCEPGCSKSNTPGDVFASNFVQGGSIAVGHQGPFENNWLWDNHFETGTISEPYPNGTFFKASFDGVISPGEYMSYMNGYSTTEVSVFDPQDRSPGGLLELWVDDGYLVTGGGGSKPQRTLIGTKASDLQKLIDRRIPPPVPLSNVTAVVNATQFRRLRLSGAYTADVPLDLPSLFVLALDVGTTYSASAAGVGDSNAGIQNMIQANGTYYTAIVGGHFDCSAAPSAFYGLTGIFGGHARAFTVSNVKVTNCGIGRNYSTGLYKQYTSSLLHSITAQHVPKPSVSQQYLRKSSGS